MKPISCVALVTPSSLPSSEYVSAIQKELPKLYPHIQFKNYFLQEQLDDSDRFEYLWQALIDPEVDLVWAVRGGSGCGELIPYLHERRQELQHLKPKILLGFSDVTALLYYWEQTLNWPAIHGPGAGFFILKKVDQISLNLIHQLLQGGLKEIILPCSPLNMRASHFSAESLPCYAANMTLLSLCGRELWEPRGADQDTRKFKNSILILEDLNEPAYKVQRAIRHLQRTGVLDCGALVLGDFFSSALHQDPAQAKQEENKIQAFFEKLAKELPIPVYQTGCVGHGQGNYLVPLGWVGRFQEGQLILTAGP